MRPHAVLCLAICSFTAFSRAGEPGPATAWSELEALKAKAREEVPIGVNAVEFYAQRNKALHEAAAAFVQKFPNDAHDPQASLWKLETTDFPDQSDQRLTLLHQNDLEGRRHRESDCRVPPQKSSRTADHYAPVGESRFDAPIRLPEGARFPR
jgi:hypothetical protein